MTEQTSKKIANNLKRIRLEREFTQAVLADKAGLNSNYYAKIERGEIKPSIENIEKIVKALGVNSSEVFPF